MIKLTFNVTIHLQLKHIFAQKYSAHFNKQAPLGKSVVFTQYDELFQGWNVHNVIVNGSVMNDILQ